MKLNNWQAIQERWEQHILEQEECDPSVRLSRIADEWEELLSAHQQWIDDPNSETAKAAALEFIDVVIVGFGYITELGFDMENLLAEKLERNHTKYNYFELEKLVSGGMTKKEVRNLQKERWNSKKA